MAGVAPLAYRLRLVRQNTALFHWSADDGDVLTSRSGQVGTYSRASGDSVVTATGTPNVAVGQPRWADSIYGAAAFMKPASSAPDLWTFPCGFNLQVLSIYVAGFLQQGASGSGSTYILRLGDGTANTLDLISLLTGNTTTALYTDGSTNPSVTLSASNPVQGDYVEYLVQLDVNRKLTLTRVINLGTPQVSALSGAGLAFTGGFHGAILTIANGLSTQAAFAYRHVLVMADA